MDDKTTSTKAVQDRIRLLSEAIDAHKTNAGRGRGYSRSEPYPVYSRGPRGRGRATYNYSSPTYRNRTLIVQSSPSAPVVDKSQPELEDRQWVQKHDRSLQLINKKVYDKMQEARASDTSGHSSSVLASNHVRSAAPSTNHQTATLQRPKKSPELCRTFCSTGQCRKGSHCHFVHDPSKVAICKEFLAKGTCKKMPYCDLSHTPTPNRVPPCSFFLRGSCTNEQCRYAHVMVDPKAPICTEFAIRGYCEKGADCTNRHESECPQYSATGSCSTPHCRLPHIDRAGMLRQKQNPAASQSVANSEQINGRSILDRLDDALSADDSSGGEQQQVSRSSNSPNETTPANFSQQDNFMSLDVDSEGDFEQRFSN